MNWIDDLARTLGEPPLTVEETALLLDLTRDVAHGTQRQYAPLSTFLLGRALAGDPDERPARIRALAAEVRRTLPDPDAG